MLVASSRSCLRTLAVLSLPALALVACGTSASSTAENADDSLAAPLSSGDVQGLTGDFSAQGFTVQNASFEFLDLSACCSSSCDGNNPSSPYGTFFVPRTPGQTVANPHERADGTSADFRMREDEAIVFVGPTPPEVRYFGFTPYLNGRVRGGTRVAVQASLSETLNDLVIGVDAPAGAPVFAQRTAIIAAADARTVRAAQAALVASGIPSSAINVMVFDPAVVHFGLQDAADTVSVLFRMAIPSDPTAFEAYRQSPGAALYRLTPNRDCSGDAGARCAPNPLPSPQPRPKNTTNSELGLTASVDALHDAIVAAYPGYIAKDITVKDGVPDPAACIAGIKETCAFDNRDTTYPRPNPGFVFTSDDEFYVVYGVDHQISKKVTYDNTTVYAAEKLVGLTTVNGDSYPGSAQQYTSTDASKLYAWKIARDCTNTPFCLEVPKGTCPTGIENDNLGDIAFRTYLEPSSKTAPDPSTLVRDRIIQFKKR